ncbi:MAG: DNA primase, partial [Alphaproteobacteria bacterium]|nr:DNA primase [Alphaproteobacteria bacterium]
MSFSAEFLTLLKSRAPLAPWIEKKFKLTRKGRLLLGNCPFHQEKTSSFTVYEVQDTFHCFGCGVHGDLIKFVMMSDHLSFRDAIEKIAETVGLRLPEESEFKQEARSNTSLLFASIEAATCFYERQLYANLGRTARTYLDQRHIQDREKKHFRIGYAPPGNALKAHLLKEGFKESILIEAGLLGVRDRAQEGDQSFDYFRDRLIFPILNKQGKPIAFGGRILKEGQPKYLNSHETALFVKGKTLYGMSEALRAPDHDAPLFVAEGYLDVIRLFERGYRAVAPLGTAMTVEQMTLLWKSCREPYILFDGDRAGREATFKLAHRVLPHLKPGCSFSAITLPDGQDPDSFLEHSDAGLMDALLKQAVPLSHYLWEQHLVRHPLKTPEHLAAADAHFKSLSSSIEDVGVQRHYDAFFKEKLFTLKSQLPRTSFSRTQAGRVGQSAPSHSLKQNVPVVHLKSHVQDSLRHRILVATILNHPDILHDVDQAFADLNFKDKKLDHLRDHVFMIMNDKKELDAAALTTHLKESGFDELIQKLLAKDLYIHASFAHAREKKETALEGWIEIWKHMVEEKSVSADITQLKVE